MNERVDSHLKALLRALYSAALEGADPSDAVGRAVVIPRIARALASGQRLGIFAVGKAARSMFEAAPRGDRALVILPHGYPGPRGKSAQVLFSSHPTPDRSSLSAAARALEFFRDFGPRDVILCLISGGASSLLCLPREGISLAQKRARIGRLMASGASIVALNRLRKRLSAIKGGKLGRSTRARLITLVLSDVPGDDPALVGSGPTVRGRRGDLVRVVGSNRSGLFAAAQEARRQGFSVRVLERRLEGEASDAGRRFARRVRGLAQGAALLAGGETTVTLSRSYGRGGRGGRGGRSLEFALAAAQELDGGPQAALLCAGSDGIDGSSHAAGAWANESTLRRALRRRLDPEEALSGHDTEPFFSALGDLLVTGPTGTNVCDWVFALRPRQGRRRSTRADPI